MRLQDYFFATPRNDYRPYIFRVRSVLAIAALLIFFQIAFLSIATFVFHRTNFLAAVLPSVLTALTNSDRSANGVGTLTENALLDKAAQIKADDMAAKGYFAHVTPDGKKPWYFLDEVGYKYTYAGENLAVNFNDSTDVENAWMKSPTHHANIVKAQYKEIGIAVANGVYKGQNATFVVQFFGTPVSGKVTAAPKAATTTVAQAKGPTATGAVLGAATESPAVVPATELDETGTPAPSESPGFFASLLTSPNQLLLWFMGTVFVLLCALLFLAVVVKIRLQYLEILIGGVLLIAIAGGSYLYFESKIASPSVELPSDDSASVYLAL